MCAIYGHHWKSWKRHCREPIGAGRTDSRGSCEILRALGSCGVGRSGVNYKRNFVVLAVFAFSKNQ
jgi:hypothetical protein